MAPPTTAGYSPDTEALKYLLIHGNLRRLENRKSGKLVMWHDVISNSVSLRSSNNFAALIPSELVQVLSKHKKRITAVFYVQRTGSIDMFSEFKKGGVLIIDVRWHLLSEHKQRNEANCRNLKQTHPASILELSFAATVRRCEDDLTTISHKINNHKSNGKSQNKRQRDKTKLATGLKFV